MNNYYNALVEVDSILEHLLEEDYNKIPKDVIDLIKENKSKDYVFEYDEELELQEQKLLKETDSLLYYIFKEYLASSVQKEKLLKWEKEDEIKAEQEKINNFEHKELFSKKEVEEKIEPNNQELVEYKESIFTKIKKWFKSIIKNS